MSNNPGASTRGTRLLLSSTNRRLRAQRRRRRNDRNHHRKFAIRCYVAPFREAARSEPKPARQRRSGTRLTIGVRLAQVALLLVLLGAWQLVASQGWIEPVLAKTPGEAWAYFTAAVQSGEISSNLRATMTAVVIAWILASAVGVAVGLSLGLLPTLERIMSPFLDAANAMPRLALAPLLIVIFGITMTAKVARVHTRLLHRLLECTSRCEVGGRRMAPTFHCPECQ
ncbi:ABC transporter permease [Rhodococcus sp. 3Y1]